MLEVKRDKEKEENLEIYQDIVEDQELNRKKKKKSLIDRIGHFFRYNPSYYGFPGWYFW